MNRNMGIYIFVVGMPRLKQFTIFGVKNYVPGDDPPEQQVS